MPEGAEIDTERLQEAIHEELEREGGRLLRIIALTTALLAALAAVAALMAGSTVNEALVLKTEAARLQAEASDQWAYYQAKGIKAAVQEAIMASWAATGHAVPPDVLQAQTRYKHEQEAIKEQAKDKERERDKKSTDADHLLHRHHTFAHAVAMFQVAIALGAVAALTKNRGVWITSIVIGIAGIIAFSLPFLR